MGSTSLWHWRGFRSMPLQEARFRTAPFRSAVCTETVAKETPGTVSLPNFRHLACGTFYTGSIQCEKPSQITSCRNLKNDTNMTIRPYTSYIDTDTWCMLICLQDLIEIHEVQLQKHQTWIIIWLIESTRTGGPCVTHSSSQVSARGCPFCEHCQVGDSGWRTTCLNSVIWQSSFLVKMPPLFAYFSILGF